MKAILRFGGREFLASQGGTFRAPGRLGEAGAQLRVPAPLVFEPGSERAAAGQARVTVLSARKGRKVLSYRFKRTKGVHKIRGSRPYETLLRVDEISIQN